MAISAPVSLASGSNGVDASSFNTAAYTPTASRLVVAFICSTRSAATAPDPALSGSNGISWTKFLTQGFNTTASPARRVSMFVGLAASPANALTTIDFAGDTQTECFWSIFEIPGTEVSFAARAVAQAVSGGGGTGVTSDSLTLGGIRNGGSIIVGCAAHAANETTTVGSGYTAIHNLNTNSPNQAFLTQYKLTPQTTFDYSYATGANHGAIAAEIRPPILDQFEAGVPL